MNGYAGRILKVDLGTGALSDLPLSPGDARGFIGGSGLAAHLFFELVAPELEARVMARAGARAIASYPDPLGPENPLIIMTGPLTGTKLPASARWTVSARSPLTGIWGEANVGGFLGAELKGAGYDGIIVTGSAEAPVYLSVSEGKASLAKADDLWGKDTYETDDILTRRHAGAKAMAIGPAGENLVRYAAIVHAKHHVAGRTGMGAVMGAKRLKAVVVRGGRGGERVGEDGGKAAGREAVPAANPGRLAELVGELAARAKESMVAQSLGEAGTIMGMDLGGLIGDVPIRNWSQGAWGDELEKVGVGAYQSYLTGKGTCFACPVGCKRKVSLEAYGHTLDKAAGAEYETLACLGPNLLISDLPALLVAGERCNRLGLDTITAGSTLAFAYEAAEKGLISWFQGSERLKDGWGKAALLLELLEDIAYRRGIGGDLAEGSAVMARKIGGPKAAGLLATVKDLEAPAHDPRAVHGMGVAYATSTRGACHMASSMYGVEHSGLLAADAGCETDGVQQSSAGKGLLQKACQDFGSVFGQAAILCQLGGNIYTGHDLLEALNAVTGFDLTMDALLECGARIWHLKRGISNLYGVTAKDDKLPPRLTAVLEEGGAAGSTPDMDLMLREWREARGLDESGFARREVLKELGLGRLDDLLAQGFLARKAGD